MADDKDYRAIRRHATKSYRDIMHRVAIAPMEHLPQESIDHFLHAVSMLTIALGITEDDVRADARIMDEWRKLMGEASGAAEEIARIKDIESENPRLFGPLPEV